jgi:serine phosphatase RsbU (regulator of sigma subunit)
VVLLTDGITEARSGREFFGYDGVESVLRTVHTEQAGQSSATMPSLQSIGRRVVDAARAFGGGTFRDDVCLFLARLEPLEPIALTDGQGLQRNTPPEASIR